MAIRLWRDSLVDLSDANRLVNFEPSRGSAVEILAPEPAVLLRPGSQWRFDGELRTELRGRELLELLRRMLKRSRQEMLDRGVPILHLAIGLLHWTDEDDQEYVSPLKLAPVDLVAPRPGDWPRLVPRDEEAIVNPALRLRLRRIGCDLPASPEKVAAALAGRDGWRVEAATLLSSFMFHREAMYRDLLDNEERIAAHPVVRGLICGTPLPAPSAAADGELPLVLETDTDQRACVAAALAGESFVLDGPPGTGKSQTVANIIGCLLHAGRRVLFVSEKAAALDVVRDRLDAAGLGPWLLDLHSDHTGRKEVATALAAAIDARPALPPGGMTAIARDTLRERREQLDGYAAAMNEVREPLGLSLFDVLGLCPDGPAPHAPIAVDGLDREALGRIRTAVDRVTRSRRVVTAAGTFCWRDVRTREPLDDLLRQGRRSLKTLLPYVRTNPALAAAFDLATTAGAGRLAALIDHAAVRPSGVRDEWLTADSLRPVEAEAERLDEARATVRKQTGAGWTALPEAELTEFDPDLGKLTAPEAERLAREWSADADRLADHLHDLAPITARMGLPPVATVADAERAAALAELAARQDKPEPFWFRGGVLATATEAAGVVRRCLEAVGGIEFQARSFFTEAVLSQPVDQYALRFTTVHRGLRKLLPAYRRELRAIAGFVPPGTDPRQVVSQLGLAVAWQRARRDLAAAEHAYAPVLGRYWQGLGTDFRALGEALKVTAETLRWAPPDRIEAVARYVCGDRDDRSATAAAKDDLARLQPPGTLEEAVADLRGRVAPLAEVAQTVRSYAAATGRSGLDLATCLRFAELRKAAAGDDLNPAALAWAGLARDLAGHPLTPAQAAALAPTGPVTGLIEAAADWEAARDGLRKAFGASRHAELDDWERVDGLLAALGADGAGQHDWFDQLDGRATLAPYGLDAVLDAEDVKAAVEQVLYGAWAEAVLRDDPRLRPLGASDRDRLVAEFRRLDRQAMAAAPGEIVAALIARRDTSAAELLRHEAMKETRHLAVREILERSWDTVRTIKPCFLMSPLTVSQLLPPDITFDVVIFDEASQITPADAVNCVYRGAALIAAGDDRQLPPTSFFDRAAASDHDSDIVDFQSVLELAKGRGSFTTRSLTHHYRSRHEGLVAFANEAFYQGRLVTFPAARRGSGVDLVRVDGVYRPGTRDNPVEAQAVAARVAHHYATRPGMSLGVVTLSVAQAEAIAAAVRREVGLPYEEDRLHGFFVKSLESVQGDERDVMIFSLAHGRDENGDVSTNFGPLNHHNGWRRLNVAITRARHQVEIVTSLRSRDLATSDNNGVQRLTAYLAYAESVTDHPSTPDSADGLSPFTQSLVAEISAWGYSVHTGLGPIDLAVLPPDGETYLLGLQYDGPAYAALPGATDRDRLRDKVLRSLGWTLHRIWTPAWHRDPDGERRRLRDLLDTLAPVTPSLPPRRVEPQVAVRR